MDLTSKHFYVKKSKRFKKLGRRINQRIVSALKKSDPENFDMAEANETTLLLPKVVRTLSITD